MIKICNDKGRIICFADPDTGLIERRSGNETQRFQLLPGTSFYYENDGYVTIVEYRAPNDMYHYTHRI